MVMEINLLFNSVKVNLSIIQFNDKLFLFFIGLLTDTGTDNDHIYRKKQNFKIFWNFKKLIFFFSFYNFQILFCIVIN
jgi:hypothetical protein